VLSPNWVKASLTPSTTVPWRPGVKYGFGWWLLPYRNNAAGFAFAGEGLGGQSVIVVPEYELILVFTAWDVIGEKRLTSQEMITRLVGAVTDRGH
jgi:CubicO group peptidase (beta-lactamase class C family)